MDNLDPSHSSFPLAVKEKFSVWREWFKKSGFLRNILALTESTPEQIDTTDPLTRIYNRHHILRLGEKELEKVRLNGGGFSVLLLDLDHFKVINDRYGHTVGDEVLKTVSDFFHELLRPADFVGRYGGEEFLVLLPETSYPEACEVAIRFRKKLEEKVISFEQQDLQITASIGIGFASDRTENLDAVLAAAGRAMHQAKRKGRNRIVAAEYSDLKS